MKYAATYHIGHHSKTRKEKAKKTARAGQRIYRVDAANKRRSRGKQGQKEGCTTADAANGFLKTIFLPKLEKAAPVQDAMETKNIEDNFYCSLCRVANHYKGFEPSDTRAYGYPYNIALSIWETENYLKQKVKDWNDLQLIQDDKGKLFLITEHRYDTGRNLFYIPIIPLYKMLKNKKRKKTACLLLSVCTYLYHIAGIPYYRQEDTYLYWEYEMIKDWIEQDDEAEEDSRLYELSVAEWVGDRMEQKLFNPINLELLPARIKSFMPNTDYEWECLQLAEQALALYNEYPNTTVFEHGSCRFYEDEHEEEEVIPMSKYISFVADTKGWLYETLAECINTEFNEYGAMEEPVIRKRFDGISYIEDNLDFENRLFCLMNDLCYLLANDLNDEL